MEVVRANYHGEGVQMISDEKQYEFIAKRVSDLANATHDGLKLFLPMFSAILGGCFWLRQQINGSPPVSYAYLSDALVVLLTLVCIGIVLDNLHAWWGYRKKIVELTKGTKHEAPPPKWFPTSLIEIGMCLAMATSCGLFVIFNPFQI